MTVCCVRHPLDDANPLLLQSDVLSHKLGSKLSRRDSSDEAQMWHQKKRSRTVEVGTKEGVPLREPPCRSNGNLVISPYIYLIGWIDFQTVLENFYQSKGVLETNFWILKGIQIRPGIFSQRAARLKKLFAIFFAVRAGVGVAHAPHRGEHRGDA